LFNSTYSHAKDIDWFVRAQEAGVVMTILPQVILLRRLHDRNRSYWAKSRTTDFLRVLKSSIDRKRMEDSDN
jgi:hypothetical protein